MDQFRGWLKQSYGKKLNKIHAWNAWGILLLAVTGIILYIPSIRGDLGVVRVILKQLHIILGIVSIGLILLYVPLIGKHWKQIRRKVSQRWNLITILFILAGWSVSGIILWQFRHLPQAWTNMALLGHDLFTWVGIPYAIYHSISRSRWLKQAKQLEKLSSMEKTFTAQVEQGLPSVQEQESPTAAASLGGASANQERTRAQAVIAALKESPISRISFLRLTAGLLLLIGVGPYFYRWLKGALDGGGGQIEEYVATDGNRMLPEPISLADSSPPIGGGGQGNFRIYTVTEIPSFTSETWKFAISGLVAEPKTFNWEDFQKIKRTVQVSNFHCVTGWSVYKVTWEGIPLSQLLSIAKVSDKAKFVKFYSGDKVYTDALSLEQAKMDDVMAAVLMDGKPIPQKLGGPIRLIVPKMFAYKSVKWLQAIELIEEEHIGYWEARGYDNDAWVTRT